MRPVYERLFVAKGLCVSFCLFLLCSLLALSFQAVLGRFEASNKYFFPDFVGRTICRNSHFKSFNFKEVYSNIKTNEVIHIYNIQIQRDTSNM